MRRFVAGLLMALLLGASPALGGPIESLLALNLDVGVGVEGTRGNLGVDISPSPDWRAGPRDNRLVPAPSPSPFTRGNGIGISVQDVERFLQRFPDEVPRLMTSCLRIIEVPELWSDDVLLICRVVLEK